MWWIVLLALIVCVGATNIINFMDGVNGITGGYSLAVACSAAVDEPEDPVYGEFVLIVAILSVVVFACSIPSENRAKCFAGDVGSIGIALSYCSLSGNW